MVKFYDVNEDGRAVVSFYPSLAVLNDLGYDNVFDMCEDLEDTVKANYPGLDDKKIAQFDPESAGFMVYCATEEVAEVVNEELNYLIQYRSDMVSDAINFEAGHQQATIKQKIQELENTLEELKKLLV